MQAKGRHALLNYVEEELISFKELKQKFFGMSLNLNMQSIYLSGCEYGEHLKSICRC